MLASSLGCVAASGRAVTFFAASCAYVDVLRYTATSVPVIVAYWRRSSVSFVTVCASLPPSTVAERVTALS